MSTTLIADRKSTRLNSSHVEISYAVFCLKKKKVQIEEVRVVPEGIGAEVKVRRVVLFLAEGMNVLPSVAELPEAHVVVIFFLMIRQPPISTLFPYTTLFR